MAQPDAVSLRRRGHKVPRRRVWHLSPDGFRELRYSCLLMSWSAQRRVQTDRDGLAPPEGYTFIRYPYRKCRKRAFGYFLTTDCERLLMARHVTARPSALLIGLVLFFVGANRVMADPPRSDNLETRCPSMAVWQRAHPHPMPGSLQEVKSQHVTDKVLETRLIEMSNAGQEAIAAWVAQLDRAHPDPKVLAELRAVQKRNLEDIESIIAKNGFPTTAQVGTAGVWAVFSLVQHADADRAFQEEVF